MADCRHCRLSLPDCLPSSSRLYSTTMKYLPNQLKIRDFFVYLFVITLLNAAPALADPTVHVVDIQKVITDSKLGKQARNSVENTNKDNLPKLKKLETELVELRKQIEQQSSILSSSAREEKLLQFRKKEKELARAITDQKEKIALVHNRHVEKIVKQVDLVLEELSKSGMYSFIIEKDPGFVLYSSSKIDITEKVIEELNKRKTVL